jgi:fumarylacetoacetate (FAA) hydrolase
MKLATYESASGPRAAVLTDNGMLIDCQSLLGESRPIRDVQALLELPNDPVNRLRLGVAMSAEAGVPLASVKLRSPVLQPPTVRDFMVYEGHASGGGTRQLSDAWYRLPIFYFSNTLRIFGPDEDVEFPSATANLDYELEIGVVIGKEGRNVLEKDWLQYVAGFTIFNDWSCRDLQRDEMAAGLGPAKGKDSATSLGPVVVTPDELTIRDGKLFANCVLKVNGEKWMENNASIAHHSWGAMIERASRDSRIAPGDVLGSGTVSGGTIGEAMRAGLPARWLKPGDVVEIDVEGIGVLRTKLTEPSINDPDYRFKSAVTL